MPARDYLNFDLVIESEEHGYSATVLSSPWGEASTTFELPFSELELENFLLRIGRPRSVVRRVGLPELDHARRFGSRLFDAALAGDVGRAYEMSRGAAENEEKGLRLRLRLTDAPELNNVPWEFLHESGRGDDFLVLSDRTPLVRYMELPRPVRPLRVTPPLRILMMVSSPDNLPRLDASGEERLLREALRDLTDEGSVEIRMLERASLSALQRALDDADTHILHYIGHGGYDAGTEEGVLALEEDGGSERLVTGSQLATMLHDHDPLRLVVLNACEGARSSSDDPFSGVAAELVRRGAPAVIAMQFEVTDLGARRFSHEFYAALARGYPVDGALASARKGLYAAGDNVEWATPVLYLRAPDGEVFDVTAADSDSTGPVAAVGGPPEPRPDGRGARVKEWWSRLERGTKLLTSLATLIVAVTSLVALFLDGPEPSPPTTTSQASTTTSRPGPSTTAPADTTTPGSVADPEIGTATTVVPDYPEAHDILELDGVLAVNGTSRLLLGGGGSVAELWGLDGRLVSTLPGHAASIRAAAFSSDGAIVATGSTDGTVLVFDTASGTRLHEFEVNLGGVSSVAIAPAGDRVAAASDVPGDGSVRMWDVATGDLVGENLPAVFVDQLAFSPDGTMLLVDGGYEGLGQMTLWDGSDAPGLHFDDDLVVQTSVTFTPDGRTVVAGNQEAEVALLDVDSRSRRGDPLEGHFVDDCTTRLFGDANCGAVTAVAVSPNGSLLASGGLDGTLLIWDLTERSLLGRLQGHIDTITVLAFYEEDATRLRLVSGEDTRVIVWRLQTP